MRPALALLARSAGPSAAATWRSRMPQSSYYQNAQFGPALQRARKQYLVRNIFTGLGIFSVAVGIYAYTIHIVDQDEFEDVTVPDAPAPAAGPPHASANRTAGS